ncbi:hypothetical protein TNIN_409321 [Trichonephila inaurata madagascariensis]|uniref:Uncharacterized protein n=1 Tax=Trichonephila inaurata madagascariensis TaxID=2747483 RepID=A0A8X7CN79_9ARAC|nr:hypothetical protein TNIN_409321 [Trichonephila inaurata madagascariensis]
MVPSTIGCTAEFAAHMLFTDECNFSRGGIFYAPNALNWTYTNSHAIRPHSRYQRRFARVSSVGRSYPRSFGEPYASARHR